MIKYKHAHKHNSLLSHYQMRAQCAQYQRVRPCPEPAGFNICKPVPLSALAYAQATLALSVRGPKPGAVCTMDSDLFGKKIEHNETFVHAACSKPGFVTSPRTGE